MKVLPTYITKNNCEYHIIESVLNILDFKLTHIEGNFNRKKNTIHLSLQQKKESIAAAMSLNNISELFATETVLQTLEVKLHLNH